MPRTSQQKILAYRQIGRALTPSVRRRLRLVFTNGCFDLLHYGHVAYLERARALGDALIVGVNSDQSIRRLKGPGRPLQTLRDRLRILAALEAVTWVVPFGALTPVRVIRAVRPDVLVKGGDWSVAHIVGRDIVESYGGRVTTIPYLPNRSTTRLIARMNAVSS